MNSNTDDFGVRVWLLGFAMCMLYIFVGFPILQSGRRSIAGTAGVVRDVADATLEPEFHRNLKSGDKVEGWEIGSRDFGYKVHPILGETRFHNGVDFRTPPNVQLYAGGTQPNVKVTCDLQPGGAGLYARVESVGATGTVEEVPPKDRAELLLMHLNRCIVPVGESKIVMRGTVIALSGGDPSEGEKAGLSTGAHLHFSQKQWDEDERRMKYVNPTYGFARQTFRGE